MDINIEATTFADGRIEISKHVNDELKSHIGGIATKVIRTEDELVKDALISLGWTPPVIDNQPSIDLEKLEDGEFYPLIDRHGDKACMVYSSSDERFWCSNHSWGFSASMAVWVGNKIQFPGKLK